LSEADDVRTLRAQFVCARLQAIDPGRIEARNSAAQHLDSISSLPLARDSHASSIARRRYMKRIRFALTAALIALPVGLFAQQPYGAVPAGNDDHLTLTGCVVHGDGGYLLTNVTPAAGEDDRMRKSGFTPARIGAADQVLYWLKNEDKLAGHEGQRVEVEGKLDGDLKKGEMEVERKDGRIEIEAKANGKKVKAVLPESDAAIGTSGTSNTEHKKVEREYLMRRFEVKSVKMVTSTCQ
jgi:hypothetical protein